MFIKRFSVVKSTNFHVVESTHLEKRILEQKEIKQLELSAKRKKLESEYDY